MSSRRSVPHVALARVPRPAKRSQHARTELVLSVKRALKHGALRDCGRRCVYCGTALAADSVTLDHVHPRAKGGANDPGNLVAACARCNRLKGDMLPLEFFLRFPWAGENFVRYARTVNRALKRGARRAVSLAYAA
jgi:5-methylcytosine-specific restriction endonuclease McrA